VLGRNVGIYSTTFQWNALIGSTLGLSDVQNWAAGAPASSPQSYCVPEKSFTGGPVVMTQYQLTVDSRVYDADHVC
ncbi:MAG: hypothetical protein LC640_12425, partial [Frankia sp.]|nr:hypothetical protein [Frankia sp.]